MKPINQSFRYIRKWVVFLVIISESVLLVLGESPPVMAVGDVKLKYTSDSLGNRIPDFSYCGYRAGETEIPFVPARVYIAPTNEDATEQIQSAIDYISTLDPDTNGFRGAVLLGKGIFNLSGRLKISSSGIVLRGSGTGEDGTTLIAKGLSRETLIRIAGENDRETGYSAEIVSDYIPVNARTVEVTEDHDFKTGDPVLIRRPSTREWIDAIGMNEFGGNTQWLVWKPSTRDLSWDVQITEISGNRITFNSPITTALEQKFGRGLMTRYSWPGRIINVGIENLDLESSCMLSNPKDEDHCWMAITIENAMDVWVRQVRFKHFAGSAVAVFESAKRVTIEDCISSEPVSEIGGQRRYTFYVSGQQTLVQRCFAEKGYHDFSVGFCATGPIAFVQCESMLPNSFSGAIDSWASGILFDNVYVNGQALCLKNRMRDAQGAGWSAANSLLWQCDASKIECFSPPTAKNWAIGNWGSFSGNADWYESDNHVKPRSIYYAQLSERMGSGVLSRAHILPVSDKASTSPTIREAEEFTAESGERPVQLREWIENAASRQPLSVEPGNAISIDTIYSPVQESVKKRAYLSIQNGWLVIENSVVAGQRIGVDWWRGNARPYAAAVADPHLTRYVPGRTGRGYTDNLQDVAAYMVDSNISGLEHNYGLWYDRRRDDHERVRRMDGEVWAPFYELPFARSGQGNAWDGLSKYDLTRYNPWYWSRLKEFADLADEKGLILLHQNYFQHNILEAGAHWADFPWRTANNINNTGFPEPPPYIGDKRIFMDEQFYDITNPVRRTLHESYIRKCLANFEDNRNVIQLIGAEYTGPLHFAEFWLDNISAWEKETGKNVLVALSTTKDVQDAILSDSSRNKYVDIIDIRYWHYRRNGSLYSPKGGQHLAPRQYARLVDPGSVSFGSVYRAVREYKDMYPEKAIIYSGLIPNDLHWAVFMAGGSLAGIPALEHYEIMSRVVGMNPVTDLKSISGPWILARDNEYLVYCLYGKSVNTDFMAEQGTFRLTWINPQDGSTLKIEERIINAAESKIEKPIPGNVLLWIIKKENSKDN